MLSSPGNSKENEGAVGNPRASVGGWLSDKAVQHFSDDKTRGKRIHQMEKIIMLETWKHENTPHCPNSQATCVHVYIHSLPHTTSQHPPNTTTSNKTSVVSNAPNRHGILPLGRQQISRPLSLSKPIDNMSSSVANGANRCAK
jgi:hypothetical protein